MASSNPVTEINGALQAKLNDDEAAASVKNGGATSVITLAGENEGAAMEASGVEELVIVEADDGDGEEEEEEEEEGIVCAYTNSNYQAVNNSMVVAGSCAVKEPGVHVVIVEHVDEIRDEDGNQDGVKEAKRG